MSKAGVGSFVKTTIPKARNTLEGLLITRNEFKSVIFIITSFIIGRVVVFEYLNPVSIAYLACFLGESQPFYLIALAMVMGILCRMGEIALIEYLCAILLLVGLNYFVFRKRRKYLSRLGKSGVALVSILFGGLIFAGINGMSLFYTIVACIESLVVFTLSSVFETWYKFMKGARKGFYLSSDELISISILVGCCFIGLEGFSTFGIAIRDYISMSAIMILAFVGGPTVGSACGIIIGIIMSAGGYPTSYLGILGVAGIVSGAFRDFGKIGSVAGFIIGGVVTTVYLDRSLLLQGFFVCFAIAGLIFVLIPQKYIKRINISSSPHNALSIDEHVERIKNITFDRLRGISRSFQSLSETFSDLSEVKNGLDQKDVSKIIDYVAESVCKNCRMFEMCWKDNFYTTYQTIFSVLSACDVKGKIYTEDIPKDFSRRCINSNGFVSSINRTFEINKVNLKWHNKIIESRELVSQQLSGVSKIIDNIGRDLSFNVTFKEKYEEIIMMELEKNKIEVDSVIVLENKQGRYEVDISLNSCGSNRLCIKNIVPIISKAVGRKFMKDKNNCESENNKKCKIRILEEQKFKVAIGVSKAVKNNESVSGDCFSSMELKNGQCYIALSDGMGSGNKANMESRTTIEILEQFMESGFEKDMAIKIINSVLILKSDEESFSTLDLLNIDLYSGNSEIVKIGAVETFLIHDEHVRVIRSSSLPIGILKDVDIETTKVKLQDGDIILMITDGISDSGLNEGNSKELWVQNALKDFKSNNPQDISDYILMKAKENSGGHIKDDMTALAVRVWEKY